MDLRTTPAKTPVDTGFPVSAISLDLTTRCLLGCSYCFAGYNDEYQGKDLSMETATKVIDWLLAPETRGDNQKIDISFWGGEPLMRWDLLQEIVLLAEAKGEEAGVKFTFSMTTNGVLMTPEKFPFFDAHGISFLLSLDGREQTHDRFRRFKNGKGSWQTIDKNAEEILKWRPNQSVRMSLSEGCLDNMMLDLNYLYDKGFNDIVYSVVHEGNWTKERMEKVSSIWREISDWYLKKRRAGRPIHLKFLDDAVGQCLRPDPNTNAPCGSGRGYLGITVDGSIWPCHRFHKMEDGRPWYEKEYCLGHIDSGIHNLDLRARFVNWNPERDMESKCASCPSRMKNCTGHCWAANLDNCGDIALVPEIGCHINRETLKEGQYVADALGIKDQPAPSAEACICDNVYDRGGGTMRIRRNREASCICNQATYTGKTSPVHSEEFVSLAGVAAFLDSAVEQADQRIEELVNKLEELSEKTALISELEALDAKG